MSDNIKKSDLIAENISLRKKIEANFDTVVYLQRSLHRNQCLCYEMAGILRDILSDKESMVSYTQVSNMKSVLEKLEKQKEAERSECEKSC